MTVKILNEDDFQLIMPLLEHIEKVEYDATSRVYTVTCKEVS